MSLLILLTINTAVTDQSKKIDRTFAQYLNQLHALSVAGNMALHAPKSNAKIYRNMDFQDPTTAPKDLQSAAAYSVDGSIDRVGVAIRIQSRDACFARYSIRFAPARGVVGLEFRIKCGW